MKNYETKFTKDKLSKDFPNLSEMIEGQDSWRITAFNNPNRAVTISGKLPDSLTAGDVMFMSPLGELRKNRAVRWYHTLWIAIDEKVRKFIGL